MNFDYFLFISNKKSVTLLELEKQAPHLWQMCGRSAHGRQQKNLTVLQIWADSSSDLIKITFFEQ